MHVRSQDWRQEGGDETAGVDREVEQGKEVTEELLLFWQLELISAERRHARLYPTGAESYQKQRYYRELSENGR